MPRAEFYASTARNLKDFIQYFAYPVFKVGVYKATGYDKVKTDAISGVCGAAFYSGITTNWASTEWEAFDFNCRAAVAAELGKKPEEMKPEDFFKSKNYIVAKELDDFRHVQKWRFATDALFLLPAALSLTAKAFPKANIPFARSSLGVIREPKNASEAFFEANGIGDGFIYAGKSAYWYYETYFIDKSAHYELIKMRENNESTRKPYVPDDLLPIVQRCRTDRNLDMLNKKERAAIMPLLQRIADYANTMENFSIPEIVYLIGMDKLRIHASDGKTICPEAIQRSFREIDDVATLGLGAIGERNRERNMPTRHGYGDVRCFVQGTAAEGETTPTPESGKKDYGDATSHFPEFNTRLPPPPWLKRMTNHMNGKPQTFAEKVDQTLLNSAFTWQMRNKKAVSMEEYISSRDYGEVPTRY